MGKDKLIDAIKVLLDAKNNMLSLPIGKDIAWLGSSHGWAWLGFSDGWAWLGSSDGRAWLRSSDGRAWLRSSHGWAWLRSSDGDLDNLPVEILESIKESLEA